VLSGVNKHNSCFQVLPLSFLACRRRKKYVVRLYKLAGITPGTLFPIVSVLFKGATTFSLEKIRA